MRRVAFATLVALVCASPLAARPHAIPAGNLVQNPGFEASPGQRFDTPGSAPPPAGWSVNGTAAVWVYGSLPDRPPASVAVQNGGGQNFLAGGAWAGASAAFPKVSTAAQTIDLAGATAEIDAKGVAADLAADLGGYGEDSARVDARFLDTAGSTLGAIHVGPVTSADRGKSPTLLRRAASGAVPAGTRSVAVVITFTGDFPKNQGFADNISLTLRAAAAPAPPPPPAAPKPKLTVTCARHVVVATVAPSKGIVSVTFIVNGKPIALDKGAPFQLRLGTERLAKKVTVTAKVRTLAKRLTLRQTTNRC